jgi:hypothetical protein
MNRPNLLSHRFLLLLFAGLTGSLSTVSGNASDCTEIPVRAEITNTTNGLKNGTCVLHFEGENEFEAYLVIKGDKKKLKDGKVEGLAKGKYAVVVTGKTDDTKFCPKYIEVKIN